MRLLSSNRAFQCVQLHLFFIAPSSCVALRFQGCKLHSNMRHVAAAAAVIAAVASLRATAAVAQARIACATQTRQSYSCTRQIPPHRPPPPPPPPPPRPPPPLTPPPHPSTCAAPDIATCLRSSTIRRHWHNWHIPHTSLCTTHPSCSLAAAASASVQATS